MNEFLALVRIEAKLLFREPVAWLAAVPCRRRSC